MNPEQIEILDYNDNAAVFLWSALCTLNSSAVDSPEFSEAIKNYRTVDGTKVIDVVLTIGGVQVPVKATLDHFFEQMNASINKRASKMALEMVTAAGFDDLAQVVRDVRYRIIDAFEKKGIKLDLPEDWDN